LRVAALGSGSEGNAVLLEGRHARVLVDAGFSGIEVERRLDTLGVEPETVDALVITHEHKEAVLVLLRADEVEQYSQIVLNTLKIARTPA
jgi:metal-dependent hydrolase (beta-lactamase superfamily II)